MRENQDNQVFLNIIGTLRTVFSKFYFNLKLEISWLSWFLTTFYVCIYEVK